VVIQPRSKSFLLSPEWVSVVVVVAILGVLHYGGIGVLPSAEVVQTVVEEIHHSRNPHPRILHSKILLLRQLQQWVDRKTNLLENVKPCEWVKKK
jgi:hypothetical protein